MLAPPSQPLAWKEFCERLPNECVVDSSEPEVIELTRETWAVINAVNEHVNTTIKPMSDREHWGVEDRWDYPEDGYGDCEDYQLLKRRLLVQAGLSRRAMRMTVVVDEEDAGHAVLTVANPENTRVLRATPKHAVPEECVVERGRIELRTLVLLPASRSRRFSAFQRQKSQGGWWLGQRRWRFGRSQAES
jgi:predicted transglutaminase-like cysteine proteinase